MSVHNEPYLIVYKNKSILSYDGIEEEFIEGKPDGSTKERFAKIRTAFTDGFLIDVIEECSTPDLDVGQLSEDQISLIEQLVHFTSEVGRALIGLTILQLCVKAIAPEQNIRLHKSGQGEFSWTHGISMRTLDKNFITPVLRKYNLLRLNADGFMMTRSLAENYPYSKLYKAAIRGAKNEWIEIVDQLETGKLHAYSALKYIISLLINRSDAFLNKAEETVQLTQRYVNTKPSAEAVTQLIMNFVDDSSYSARVFEISLHCLFQVLDQHLVLPGKLKPLTQMRSANKKHGNIGDIEIVSASNEYYILEAWDAKYGKPYLRDEIEEISEKLMLHTETETAGFVVNGSPLIKSEIEDRMQEISDLHHVNLSIHDFNSWVSLQLERVESVPSDIICREWIMAIVETIAQRRRDIAPVDEPCDNWLEEIKNIMERTLN